MPTSTANKIVIAGGSGFLGTSLADFLLEQGFEVVVFSRRQPSVSRPWRFALWDARTFQGDWYTELNGARAVINLVGRTVDCIKSPDHCDEILRSRVEATRVLGQACRQLDTPPPVWVQMSTAHIYGDPPDVICDEKSAFGYGLAPDVGKAWEAEFEEQLLTQQRGIVLRTSFVIGKDRGSGGGALTRLKFLTRLGLGGTIGHGHQGMSWIHERDMNRIFEKAITDQSMKGAYIASSPEPVSQREFSKTLRSVMKVPIGLPAMEWMVRLGAPLVMKTDPELALYGRYVQPKRLLEAGFSFDFPELKPALYDLFKK